MMQKIESLFKSKLNIEKFTIISAVTLFVADILNILYIDRVFLRGEKLDMMLANSLRIGGYNPADVPFELVLEMRGAFISTFWIFLILFLINNSIFYVLFARHKKAGIKYVRGYAFFGFLLTLINCFTPDTESIFWKVVLILSTIVYLNIFLGMKVFYPKTSAKISEQQS